MAQYAVERDPSNPLMHGLLATLYYRQDDYSSAASEFTLAVQGGLTSKGVRVEPIPADGTYTFIVYYVRYGVSLANLNRCSEALQIADQLLKKAPTDDTARINAQDIQGTCRSLLENPVPEGTTTPDLGPTPTP